MSEQKYTVSTFITITFLKNYSNTNEQIRIQEL